VLVIDKTLKGDFVVESGNIHVISSDKLLEKSDTITINGVTINAPVTDHQVMIKSTLYPIWTNGGITVDDYNSERMCSEGLLFRTKEDADAARELIKNVLTGKIK
jgi:hypothetical protein